MNEEEMVHDFGELLWQMSVWMRRAERVLSRDQRILYQHFLMEGRLLRDQSDAARAKLGHEGQTTRT